MPPGGSRARAHGRRTAPRGAAPARRARAAAGRREPARPCPSARGARPARPRPRRRRARASAAPISTSPGCAACSSRAATLTASPVASRSSVPVTTSPVMTPIRPSRPSSGQRVPHLDRRAAPRAARRPRAATGTPNTAITASPMNFSTVPPWRSTIALHPLEVAREQRAQPLGIERLAERGRAGHIAEQHRHGLALLVRSARGPAGSAPHSGQNLNAPSDSKPHFEQAATRSV